MTAADAPLAGDDAPIFAVSTRRYLRWGFATVLGLVVGLGGWAALTTISGAVVAQGVVVVGSRVKEIQHREGGIIGAIHVDDGERVNAGDLLVRLDDTQPRAGRDIVAGQLLALQARLDRLSAERDRADAVAFRPALLERAAEPEIAEILASQTGVFTARKDSLDGQTAQLREQIAQLQEQIRGLDAQLSAKRREIELVAAELADLRELGSRDLVPRSRVTERERESVRLEGEAGDLTARIATARGRIAEIEMQVLQTVTEFGRTVLDEIAEVQTEIATLAERNVAADDELTRVELRAPVAGIVHELAVGTVGGVVAPGATLMKIVPNTDDLLVEAKVAPIHIDEIANGQTAEVLFSGLGRSTPRLSAAVRNVAADRSRDEATNTEFFVVRIAVPEAERARLGEALMTPGMPADVFIQTRDRTVLSYLLEPLLDAADITFTES